MSHSTNSNVNFCDVCDFSFETKKGIYGHQSYNSEHKKLLESSFVSDDEAPSMLSLMLKGLYPLQPNLKSKLELNSYLRTQKEYMSRMKTSTFSFLKLKRNVTPKILLNLNPNPNLHLKKISTPELSMNVQNIFQHLEALTTHSYSHNPKYLENTEYFDINSSQNIKEFYILIKLEITLKI